MRNEFFNSQMLILLFDYFPNKSFQYCQINDCHEEDECFHSYDLVHPSDHIHDQYFD